MYSNKFQISNFKLFFKLPLAEQIDTKGQTLLELVVVIAVIVVVVAALVFATIASLRNANFAKNQAQGTKLAQEGLEKVRSIRDRDLDGAIDYIRGTDGSHASKFSDLWDVDLVCPSNCYFYFNQPNVLKGGADSEKIPPDNPLFKRQIIIENYTDGKKQKKVTAVVSWTDFSGSHESRLTTVLSNPKSL